MKPRVLITREVPEAALAIVRDRCECQYDPSDRQLTPDELVQGVANKDGLLCVVTDRVDEAVLASSPALKVVSTIAVGYDNIDVAAATARGIAVANTPGVLTESCLRTWPGACSSVLHAVSQRAIVTFAPANGATGN